MIINKKRIAAILIGIMCLSSLAGCGKEEETPYSSPNFSTKSEQESTEESATKTSANVEKAINVASYSDAENNLDPSTLPASLSDALPMGTYQDNVYYNGVAGFKITADGNIWRLFDEVDVASATGATSEDIEHLWLGYSSPYDEETSYAAIAYNQMDGSNVIVSYINPEAYLMPEFSAYDYLDMAAKRYEDVDVNKVTFLGQEYLCIDMSNVDDSVGRRTQFAIDKEGLIVLITFTLHDETTLEDAVKIFTPLYY